MGVPIEENKCLFSLNCADQVIIAQDADDLEYIIRRLNKAYKESGLTINFNKTEFIAINTDLVFYITLKKMSQLRKFKNLNISVV